MTKKSKKQAREELLRKKEEERRHSLWSPDLSPDELKRFREITHAYFAAYDEHVRLCSVPHEPAHYDERAWKSHIGGRANMPPDALWPVSEDGQPLSLVFEAWLNEARPVPSELSGANIMQVFLELGRVEPPDYLKQEAYYEYNDGDWAVRTWSSLDRQVEKSEGVKLPSRPVAWKHNVTTHPGDPDDFDIVPDEISDAFDALPRSSELHVDRVSTGLGPRLGGWPAWLTGGDVGEFILQLDGDFLNLDLGFDAQLYFGLREGEWNCLWEIG